MEEGNHTDCDDASYHQEYILRPLSVCCGSVSLFFCLLLFFIAALFHKYRSTTQRVVLYLTVSVSLSSVYYILNGSLAHSGTYCLIAGFIGQETAWMVLLAVCCLTFDLFVKVVFLKFDTSRYEVVYCILIFLFPLSFNWIPFIHYAYGDRGAQCWIREKKRGSCTELDYYALSLRYILYWVPFLIIVLTITIVFTYLRIKAYRRLKAYSGNYDPQQQLTKQLIEREIRLYQLYPVVFVLTFVGALLVRIAEAVEPGKNFFYLGIVNIVSFNFQGFAIALLSVLDYDTRTQLTQYHSIKLAVYNLFCCCRIRSVQEYEVIPVPTDSLQEALKTRTSSDVI